MKYYYEPLLVFILLFVSCGTTEPKSSKDDFSGMFYKDFDIVNFEGLGDKSDYVSYPKISVDTIDNTLEEVSIYLNDQDQVTWNCRIDATGKTCKRSWISSDDGFLHKLYLFPKINNSSLTLEMLVDKASGIEILIELRQSFQDKNIIYNFSRFDNIEVGSFTDLSSLPTDQAISKEEQVFIVENDCLIVNYQYQNIAKGGDVDSEYISFKHLGLSRFWWNEGGLDWRKCDLY